MKLIVMNAVNATVFLEKVASCYKKNQKAITFSIFSNVFVKHLISYSNINIFVSIKIKPILVASFPTVYLPIFQRYKSLKIIKGKCAIYGLNKTRY